MKRVCMLDIWKKSLKLLQHFLEYTIEMIFGGGVVMTSSQHFIIKVLPLKTLNGSLSHSLLPNSITELHLSLFKIEESWNSGAIQGKMQNLNFRFLPLFAPFGSISMRSAPSLAF
jgi:hypothetical protein